MNRRNFIKKGALFLPAIFVPRWIRAVPANCNPAFFKSKPATGGGGGGDGTFSFIAYTDNSTSGTNTTSATNTTGANGIAIGVRADTATPTDSKSNTWVKRSTAPSQPGVDWFDCISPTVGSGHTFTGASGPIIVVAFAKSGGAPSFDAETHAGTSNHWQGGPIQPGSITPAGTESIFITSASWDANITPSTTAIDSSFTKQSAFWNSAIPCGMGCATKIKTGDGSAENPNWSESGGLDPSAKSSMVSYK